MFTPANSIRKFRFCTLAGVENVQLIGSNKIVGRFHADLKEFYDKGIGTFRARATWEIEEGNIVVTAFPYQVSPSRVLQQIDEQWRA